MDIKKKTIFITGGTSGIGLETAKKFLAEEANVVIYSPNADQHGLDADLRGPGDEKRVLIVQGDVCDRRKVKNAIEKAIERFGSLDVLINNAAIAKKQPFIDSAESDWDKMIGVNLKGTFIVTQEFIKALADVENLPHPNPLLGKEREEERNLPGKGRREKMIINISSGAGLYGVKDLAVYSATKAGVITFTQAINLELKGVGIEAITVTPGSVDTRMFRELFPDQKPHHTPQQVAQIIYEVATGEIKPDNRQVVDVFYHTR